MTHVYLTQCGHFSAAHSHDGTLAEELHTHTFMYEATFYGPLNQEGYLLDFRDVQKTLADIVRPLEKQNLSTLFPSPTTENICIWLFQQTAARLPHLAKMRLAEEPDRWITYKGE